MYEGPIKISIQGWKDRMIKETERERVHFKTH